MFASILPNAVPYQFKLVSLPVAYPEEIAQGGANVIRMSSATFLFSNRK